MEIQSDWIALLREFNAAGVEYMVVGAAAIAYHGSEQDVDDAVARSGDPTFADRGAVRSANGATSSTNDECS
jgi:hypothetical protein